MGNNYSGNNKAISEVISMLLIVMITLGIFAIVYSVVVPFIKNSLEDSKTCYDVLGKLEVVEDELTCYNKNSQEIYVNIKLKDADIDGILVSLRNEVESKTFEIPNSDEVKMYWNYSAALEIPGKNEERTYVFDLDFIPDGVVVAPIVNEKTCDESAEVKILEC
ncbi:MAG: hypothetical protein PHC28_01415 [Flavobacterium sp.]|uniref:hypothetical protein n=1 Tax=Flavobacterium sp. TaxID=239 RepID=UPI00261A98EA|nr:hypothetical protein [Flavobacterium sp.]MDD5149126.1 hypothetical protein [Flavobacterium sp.]